MTLGDAVKVREILDKRQRELRRELFRVNLEKMVHAMRLNRLAHGKPDTNPDDTLDKWRKRWAASPK